MANSKNSYSWWHKLLAEGETNTVSHKRLVSVISLIMLVVLSLLSAFGYPATTDYIYLFGMLTGGESLLTTVEKATNKITGTKCKMRESENAEPTDA
jgi:hypothetical protein